VWRPPDYGKHPLFHPEDEGSTSLRNAGDFTSRHRVASQNIWIYSSTSVITSILTVYWQCFFQGQQQEAWEQRRIIAGKVLEICHSCLIDSFSSTYSHRYITSESDIALSPNVAFIFQKLSSKASTWTARWFIGLCGKGQVHCCVQIYSRSVAFYYECIVARYTSTPSHCYTF